MSTKLSTESVDRNSLHISSSEDSSSLFVKNRLIGTQNSFAERRFGERNIAHEFLALRFFVFIILCSNDEVMFCFFYLLFSFIPND